MDHHTDTHATGNDDLAVADAVGVVRPFVITDQGVEVPAQRPASVLDEIAADHVASARAVALAIGVEQGPDLRLNGTPFPTVFVVVGGTRPRSADLAAAPFVAVVTGDEHGAWVTAADLITGGTNGARVEAHPLF